MPPADQQIRVEIPEQPELKARPQHGELKLRTVNRQQTMMANIYVEELIPADHKARAIEALVMKFDLSQFTESLRTTQGLRRSARVAAGTVGQFVGVCV